MYPKATMTFSTRSVLYIICLAVFLLLASNLSWSRHARHKLNFGSVMERQSITAPASCMVQPLNVRCIPGMVCDASNTTKCHVNDATHEIRKVLFDHAKKRGQTGCNVYAYLSTETLRQRHVVAARLLETMQPSRILDIGAYTNPIHSFMSHCPKEVTVIEPCGELSHTGDNPYFSGNIECGTSNQSTLLNVFPTSIKTFVGTSEATHYDVALCIGCDSAYGPTWKELMLLPRPVTIILEASISYAFNGQRGSYPTEDELSDGCKLKYKQKFDFSNCTDCGFHGPMSAHTDYGKDRQLVVFECLDRPPNVERHQKASAALEAAFDCKQGENSYRGMACISERHASDTAFMVLNATSVEEVNAMAILTDSFHARKICSDCAAKPRQDWKRCREWHTETDETFKHYETIIKKFRGDQHSNMSASRIWEDIIDLSHLRCDLASAKPDEKAWPILKESIVLYDQLFEFALKIEHKGPRISDRFLLQSCPPHLDTSYFHEVAAMEPILENGRNLQFREKEELISFHPYRHLLTFPAVREAARKQKRILIDVGANGFSSSPKHLIDMYGAYLPFHQVIMFEPHIDGMQYIPTRYKESMSITFHQQYVEIGTRSPKSDILSWLAANVRKEDFVVLKFDVDEGVRGMSMEWGFLEDLMYASELGLVDELFIELHYWWNKPGPWLHQFHSGQQRYDIVNQLRECGVPIHDWP